MISLELSFFSGEYSGGYAKFWVKLIGCSLDILSVELLDELHKSHPKFNDAYWGIHPFSEIDQDQNLVMKWIYPVGLIWKMRNEIKSYCTLNNVKFSDNLDQCLKKDILNCVNRYKAMFIKTYLTPQQEEDAENHYRTIWREFTNGIISLDECNQKYYKYIFQQKSTPELDRLLNNLFDEIPFTAYFESLKGDQIPSYMEIGRLYPAGNGFYHILTLNGIKIDRSLNDSLF